MCVCLYLYIHTCIYRLLKTEKKNRISHVSMIIVLTITHVPIDCIM